MEDLSEKCNSYKAEIKLLRQDLTTAEEIIKKLEFKHLEELDELKKQLKRREEDLSDKESELSKLNVNL